SCFFPQDKLNTQSNSFPYTTLFRSVVFSLMPDEKFDRLYNPGHGRVTHTGWGPVLVAIMGTLVGATAGIFGIAMVVVYTWTAMRSEEHTSELQSRENLVCRLLLEKK